jgi:hypothetical protein
MIAIEGPWAKWKPFLYRAGYQGDRGPSKLEATKGPKVVKTFE